MLSITGQDRETVEPFVETNEAAYPILCKAMSGAYGVTGLPSAFLIGSDGTVVWQGHPAGLGDSDIETYLKDIKKEDQVSTWAFTLAKQVPEMPKAFKGVMKLLEKRKFGAALKKVDGSLAKLEGDDKEAGDAVQAWITNNATGDMEAAAQLVRDGQIYNAFLKYEGVEERFKGHALAKQAKASASALKKGKETKLEIKASEKLVKIKAEMRDERKAEDKLACLKPLLSKKYTETLAGKQAAEMAEELEKKVEK